MQTLIAETSQFAVKVTATLSLEKCPALLEMSAKISSPPSQKSNNPCCGLSYHILLLNLYLQYFTSFLKAHCLPGTTASLGVTEPQQLLVFMFLPCCRFSSALFCICCGLRLCTLDKKVWCICDTLNWLQLIWANSNCSQNLKTTAPHQVIRNVKSQLRTHNPNLLKMSIWTRLDRTKVSPNIPCAGQNDGVSS